MNPIKLEQKLQKCKDWAINKNGLCLSTNYQHDKIKMLWQCSKGHQWEAVWHNIKGRNSWCPYCDKQTKPEIEELKNYAISKSGLLLSEEYKNNTTKLLWQCNEGHKWEAHWNSIKNLNSWCPYCAKVAILKIEELQKYAISKHGLLLSTEYKNNKADLLWQCNKKHQWLARWNNISDNNSWCPECSSLKTEKLCRKLIEDKLNLKFKKTRFYYDLQNCRKFLEFDGYNKENNIAFEFHGYQHYQFPNTFHKTLEEFEAQKLRDDFKEQYAAENNIRLIVIPYTQKDNLENFINKGVVS